MGSREKWDAYYQNSADKVPTACSVLSDYGYLLPSRGKALDLACGMGGNALYLAERKLQTTAVDVSAVALESLVRLARSRELELSAVQKDIDEHFFARNKYDVITVSNYLDRPLFQALQNALNPGGLLFYQTFVKNKVNNGTGPSRPDYLLDTNELLTLLPKLSVLVYFDLECQGDVNVGLRNQSCLVAKYQGS